MDFKTISKIVVYYSDGTYEEVAKFHPFPAPMPYPYPNSYPARCHKCGMNISATMGYVCSDPACPTFGGVTCK